MRYLVISDTHDNLENIRRLFEKENVAEYEQMLFLGDFVSPFTVAELLKRLPEPKKIFGVFGNNEGDKVTILKVAKGRADLRDYLRFMEIEGLKVLLMHGFGPSQDTEQIALSLAKSGDYDIILFGHTHKAKIFVLDRSSRTVKKTIEWDYKTDIRVEASVKSEVIVFNPGTLGGWLAEKASYGVLEISGEKVIIELKAL